MPRDAWSKSMVHDGQHEPGKGPTEWDICADATSIAQTDLMRRQEGGHDTPELRTQEPEKQWKGRSTVVYEETAFDVEWDSVSPTQRCHWQLPRRDIHGAL